MTLLHGRWQLEAAALPERLLARRDTPFRLPGSEALSAFADLLGDAPQASPAEPEAAPFAVPQLLPRDITGPAMLRRDIHFGPMSGDHAQITFAHVCGRGTVTLGDAVIGRFSDGPLTLDVTQALLLAKTQRLALHFDETRPAGIAGPVTLRLSRLCRMTQALLCPNAMQKRLEVRICLLAEEPGAYLVRLLLARPDAQPVICEKTVTLKPGAPDTLDMEMAFDAPPFVCSAPYAPRVLRAQLFALRRPKLPPPAPKCGLFRIAARPVPDERPDRIRTLCDELTLTAGTPGLLPACWLPMTPEDLRTPPETLSDSLHALGIPAVLLPAQGSDWLYACLTRNGIAALHSTPTSDTTLLRHPCAVTQPVAAEAQDADLVRSAWRLCGMVISPRPVPPQSTPDELLRELFGRPLNDSDPGIRSVLLWLRALSVQLRAEAIRQGRCAGALTAPGEWCQPDIAEALCAAFTPSHLSALPLYGAWWAKARFFATLQVFLPEDWQPGDSLTAAAALEDEQGQVLAQLEKPVLRPGYLGMLEAMLPNRACVLELTCTLRRNGRILEHHTLPVYVGVLAHLEAAI